MESKEKEYGLIVEETSLGKKTVIKRCSVCDDNVVWVPNANDIEYAKKIVERRFAELHLECAMKEVF